VGLTLRPLAARLDVSVSTLTNRFGSRDEIIASITGAARADDAAHLARWSQRIATLPALSSSIAADVAEAILDDMAGVGRQTSVLFLELLQACAWDQPLRGAFAAWLAERTAFWANLARRAHVPQPAIDAGLVQGYMVDELVHTLALGDWPAYRILRKLGLNRLFSGFARPTPPNGDAELFNTVFRELEYQPAALSVVHGAPITADWRGAVAKAAAHLITTRGAGAVTHRAVATESQVKTTTLAYRFPTQEDLVVGGLEYIIARLLRRMDEDESQVIRRANSESDPGIDIGRATFAVALHTPHMERLKPCSADMRRCRGINLIKFLKRQSPNQSGLDDLSAQAMSVALVGLGMTLNPDSDRIEDRMRQGLKCAIDWARQAELAQA